MESVICLPTEITCQFLSYSRESDWPSIRLSCKDFLRASYDSFSFENVDIWKLLYRTIKSRSTDGLRDLLKHSHLKRNPIPLCWYKFSLISRGWQSVDPQYMLHWIPDMKRMVWSRVPNEEVQALKSGILWDYCTSNHIKDPYECMGALKMTIEKKNRPDTTNLELSCDSPHEVIDTLFEALLRSSLYDLASWFAYEIKFLFHISHLCIDITIMDYRIFWIAGKMGRIDDLNYLLCVVNGDSNAALQALKGAKQCKSPRLGESVILSIVTHRFVDIHCSDDIILSTLFEIDAIGLLEVILSTRQQDIQPIRLAALSIFYKREDFTEKVFASFDFDEEMKAECFDLCNEHSPHKRTSMRKFNERSRKRVKAV